MKNFIYFFFILLFFNSFINVIGQEYSKLELLPHIQKLVESVSTGTEQNSYTGKGFYMGIPEQSIFVQPGDCDPKKLPSYCNIIWRFVKAEPTGCMTSIFPTPLPLSLASSSIQQFIAPKPEELERTQNELEEKKLYQQTECSDEECKKLREQMGLTEHKKNNDDSSQKDQKPQLSVIKLESCPSMNFVQWPEERYKKLIKRTYRNTEQRHKWQARKEAKQEMHGATPGTPSIPPDTLLLASSSEDSSSALVKKSRKK